MGVSLAMGILEIRWREFDICMKLAQLIYKLIICLLSLFVWCLTARQHRIGQFVPTVGECNRLRWAGG